MQSGISPQRAVIGSSTIGPTGQPDIRSSDSGRDDARPSQYSVVVWFAAAGRKPNHNPTQKLFVKKLLHLAGSL